MMSHLPVWKRAALVPFLLLALWVLTDNDTQITHHGRHHLAVFTALRRHPPCLRVYRSLLEVNLLLWGVAASLWLWKKTIGDKMLGHLLFQPATLDLWGDRNTHDDNHGGMYEPVDDHDRTPLTPEDILTLGKSSSGAKEDGGDDDDKPEDTLETAKAGSPLDESDIWDAQYDSDGEVPQEPVGGTPPEVMTVVAVAVDSLVLILISLFFFTLSSAEGGRYVDGMDDIGLFRFVALVAAPIFPLVLFVAGLVAVVYPWKGNRSQFWTIVSFTVGAPMYHVTFRDGFIGDILTSSVRPMQDIAFTFFYFVSGLQGWWKQAYDLDSADLPLEKNWILHTCILPMCMASPLWWRFLQNLRQAYENKRRWPYLGNALKYFLAAQVAVFGVFYPHAKQSFFWLASFVVATLYQIWWDVFMDWELLVVSKSGRVRLRSTRIYSVQWIYWTILVLNVLLRFCWTLSFVPHHYLNRAGVLSPQFKGDLSHILDPTIASAEIIRRTLWGFLRVEWEAIKVGRQEPSLKGTWSDSYSSKLQQLSQQGSRVDDEDIHFQIMEIEKFELMPVKEVNPSGNAGWWLPGPLYYQSDLQVLGEMCIYATAFSALGLLAAAHRVTL